MNDLQLDLLEKKVQVIQNEVSEVIGQMQQTIQSLAKMTQIAMRVLDSRISNLEAKQQDSTNVQEETT